MKKKIQSHLTDNNRFKLIEDEIESIFLRISEAETINDAEPLFIKLEEIQFELARLVFKDKINITSYLRRFVYDFDRLDDMDVKTRLYNNLKK